MQNRFKKWLLDTGKAESTAEGYSKSINKISQHYSKATNQQTDIYKIADINYLSTIRDDYSQGGKFSVIGHEGNGTKRNAIARYVEFFTQNTTNNKSDQIKNESIETSENQTFSYEKDLKTSLCLQIKNLFPNYKIYGDKSEGIEYSIENHRIDVLLENIETENLLAVELKSGNADYKVFGQISMYIGLLQEKFPKKNVKGVIIAGSIHNGLIQAVSITDKIELKKYSMKIELEEI